MYPVRKGPGQPGPFFVPGRGSPRDLAACYAVAVIRRPGPRLVRVVALFTCLLLAVSASRADPNGDFVYIAGGLVGSFPEDREAVFQNQSRNPTNLRTGAGAVIKAAVFPSFARHVIGLELESTAHSGRLQVPVSPNGLPRTGASSLTVFSTMANLLVQYPSAVMMPYVGVGLGWATGLLTDTDIPERPDRGFEGASALSYQFLGGVRARVSERLFLFTEYKYLAAHWHWSQLAVDFKTHYGIFGIGYTF